MTKRVKYVIASITTAGAVALTILAGSRSLRNSDGSEVEPQSEPVEPQPEPVEPQPEPVEPQPEPVEPQPELRSNPLPDRNVPGDSSAGSVSSVRWGRRLLPPQWIVFLVLAAALSIKAFGYLPPESQDLSSELSPTIDISVSRPDVQLLAVLDGSQASDGDLFVELYADGVPGGFRWRITGSNDLSTDDGVPGQGSLTDQVTGKVRGSNSGLYFVLTEPSITPDLQAALNGDEYNPTVIRGVREDDTDYSRDGSNLAVKLPTLEFSGSRTSHSPTGWYAPSGKVVILGPSEIQTYQTNITSPAFSSPGMWEGTSKVAAPYWSGTNLAIQSQENRDLFIAGLLFGIAGSALVACFQDVATRYRSWRDKRDSNRREPNLAAGSD